MGIRKPRRRNAAFVLAVTLVALTAACGGGGGSPPPPPPPPITVSVSPTTQNVFLGAQQPFTATVSGTSNTAVTWSVNGITGGNATVGTISATGVFTAPAILPSPAAVSIRATSVASGTSSASANVTVTSDVVVSITAPAQNASVEVGAQQQITKNIASTGNGADPNVTWSVSGTGCAGAACGTITSGGVFTAPGILPATAGNNVTVTATSVADPSKTTTLTLHIVANFAFAITGPASGTIDNAKSFLFTFTLTPVPNSNPSTTVSWSVAGVGCAGTACGTIDQAGLYTAPNTAPSPATVTITGTPAADPSKFQSVTVTINTIVVVAISPTTLNIEIEAQQMFTANVGGTQNQNVTWSISGPGCSNPGNPCGSISNLGPVVGSVPVTYTAPISIPSGGIGPVTITATSVQDITKSASVTATFFSTIQPSLLPSGSTRAVNHRQTLDAVLVRTSTGTAPVNNAVEWRVNGVLGGNASMGFICQKASDGIPCSQTSVTPSGPPSAPFQVDYLAPAVVPAGGAVTIEMRSQADSSKFITAVVTVVANVTVNVSPSTSTLPTNGTQQFTANVVGAINQAVTWSVAAAAGGACNEASLVPSGAGKISCGTINVSGNYTAPSAAPAASSPGNQVSITATSVDSPGQSGSGTVTISAGAFISKISPASITALGAGSTDFTLKVQGSSFLAGAPGSGSIIVFNAQNLSTNCASTTVCTATILASSVTSPGDYGVQIFNPPSAPQPGLSNQVALKVLDPATQRKDFDNAPVVALTAGAPDATGQNILVVEPTTAGSLTEHYNMDLIGIVSGSSCNLRGTGITLTRPTSGTQTFDICVENSSIVGPSLSVADTFTISGPNPNDITIQQVQSFGGNNFIIQITLQLGSTSKVGPRTLFAESKNREKAALVGAIEVK